MEALKIAIDARMYNEAGIGRYIRNLIRKLQVIDKKNEYFILHLKSDYDRLVYHNNFRKVLADFRWYGAVEQFKLPKLLRILSPDLVHFPHFNVPIFYEGKFVVTIHDLIHQHFSMERATTHGSLVYKLKRLGYKKVFEKAIKKSEKILVPSSFVREQLVKDWKVDVGKVVVTHEAVDDKILSIVNKMKIEDTRKVLKKFNIKSPFIFYVGNAHPHKNVEGLIAAFKKLKVKYADLSLVLSGSDHYFWEKVKKNNPVPGIFYTGYLTDEELVVLYKSAQIFVMPSFEEGFGIPILEAMASGCPVVVSKAGALPEVGGDAAVYFDPNDREDVIDKINKVLASEELRQDLIKKGHVRAKLFSWEKLARKTLEVYQECV